MTARLRLLGRRLFIRAPLAELVHIVCPLLRPGCPCMEGWDGR